MTPTDETRFHALKFAIQNRTGDDARCLVKDAETFASFLALGSVPTPEQPVEDVELADLTESYPADEPIVAVADSPMEAEQIVDELFGDEPEPSFTVIPAVEEIRTDWLSEQPDYAREPEPSPELMAAIEETEAAAAAYVAEITAAVEQIADPAPVTEDASEAPEMTDEQVERTEDHWRLASDQIGEAEQEPEKELEMAGAYMRFKPWFSRT